MRNQEHITPIDQYVIDFVRNLRQSKKLTQEDIANILHVSRSFIKDVESINIGSKFNVRHINALADYFNMSPKDFLPSKPFPVDTPKEKIKTKTRTPLKKVATKKKATAPVKKRKR